MNAKREKIIRTKGSPTDDFKIIAIASHEKDYQLAWNLNTELSFDFSKKNDLIIQKTKANVQQVFSRFSCTNDILHLTFDLIANKSEQGFLLNQFSNIDFFLKISGETSNEYMMQLNEKIKKCTFVITSFLLDKEKIKNSEVFVF